jgi:serine/threonine protein kinase
MDDIKTEANYGSTFHTVLTTPEVIGKYEIIGEVGKGSMGTVYQANDPFSDRHVAIKVAHPQFINENEDGKRFRKLFFNEAHAEACN